MPRICAVVMELEPSEAFMAASTCADASLAQTDSCVRIGSGVVADADVIVDDDLCHGPARAWPGRLYLGRT